ncbi:hypothetical protein DID88_008591 [Monilinia fructigena]|uniref:Uncharacterized protein n=1 Tax=Monilinia fructigena TaxID=38457 RepID=A0A395J6I7_9HELO|nr:hypothetical protein DID88_008591 [Monilinia fructigena]
MVTNPLSHVLPRIELTNDQPFWDELRLPVVPSRSFTVPERWSLMLKCAICPREALLRLAEPYGRQILASHRIRYFMFPVLNPNDAVFMLNGSMPGIRHPPVNQIPESTCLWSSSSKAASRIGMLRTPKCPSGKEPYLFLYTQREYRGEYTISDWPGPETRGFEDAGLEEWSLSFSCSRKGEAHVRTGPAEELMIWSERYTIANATQLPDTDELPEILPSQENATLALTSTLTPQIFQIPLLTCLTSSSSSSSPTFSYNVSSLLRIVSLPICPPNQTSHTALYAEEDCNSIRHMMIGPKSYPLYRPLFSFAPWLETWSLGFVCIPDGATLSYPAKWEKIMELVVERKKGMGPAVPGQGRDIIGTTVQLVSKSESEPKPKS